MTLWVVYDNSPARLPVAVFESAAEAAEFTGSPISTVQSIASRAKKGDKYAWRFASIKVKEDEI